MILMCPLVSSLLEDEGTASVVRTGLVPPQCEAPRALLTQETPHLLRGSPLVIRATNRLRVQSFQS